MASKEEKVCSVVIGGVVGERAGIKKEKVLRDREALCAGLI